MKRTDLFTLKLILIMACLLFSPVLFSQNVIFGENNILSAGWIADNWPIVLLAISEILALFPGSDTGILKVIINIIKRLLGILAKKTAAK